MDHQQRTGACTSLVTAQQQPSTPVNISAGKDQLTAAPGRSVQKAPTASSNADQPFIRTPTTWKSTTPEKSNPARVAPDTVQHTNGTHTPSTAYSALSKESHLTTAKSVDYKLKQPLPITACWQPKFTLWTQVSVWLLNSSQGTGKTQQPHSAPCR